MNTTELPMEMWAHVINVGGFINDFDELLDLSNTSEWMRTLIIKEARKFVGATNELEDVYVMVMIALYHRINVQSADFQKYLRYLRYANDVDTTTVNEIMFRAFIHNSPKDAIIASYDDLDLGEKLGAEVPFVVTYPEWRASFEIAQFGNVSRFYESDAFDTENIWCIASVKLINDNRSQLSDTVIAEMFYNERTRHIMVRVIREISTFISRNVWFNAPKIYSRRRIDGISDIFMMMNACVRVAYESTYDEYPWHQKDIVVSSEVCYAIFYDN
jgi:hypothetical protein